MSFRQTKISIQTNNKGKENNIKNIKNDFSRYIIKKSGRTVLSASMTMEAAFIIPLFVFFTIALIHVINIVGFENRVNEAMYNAVRQCSVAEYVKEGTGNAAIAHGLAIKDLCDPADTVGVRGKAAGLIFLRSDSDGENIDYILDYVVKSPAGFLGIRDITCSQKLSVRKWIGNDDSNGDRQGAENEKSEIVYITESGTVYHRDRECTHLRLSITAVSINDVENMRNNSQGKYYKCEKCHEPVGNGTVYITNTGDRYHSSKNCSGLKRGILSVLLKDIPEMPPCSRCG